MIDNVKKFIDTLVKFEINANQMLFLTIVHKKDYAPLYKFVTEGIGFLPEEIDELVDKGLVINLNSDDDYYLDSFITTDKFIAGLFFEDEEIAPSEFWDAYPRMLYVDGKRFAARNTDKDQFFDDYNKEIGMRVDRHKHIMSCLEYAVKNRLVNMGIRKWFDSKQWEAIEEEMQQRKESGNRELPGETIF
jgi:hypothetical protein